MQNGSDIFANFNKRFEGYAKEAKKQKEEEALKEEKQRTYNEANNLVKFPQIWPEAMRGVPNSVLRGSLFAAIQGKSVKYCKDIILHESEKLIIKYTGERLTQSDLDVWEYALHLARQQCLGHKIYFTERSFLKELSKDDSIRNYKWLDKIFTKLCACAVKISHNGFTYMGSLIQEGYRDEKEKRYLVVINPKLARLFEAGNTWISWEERKLIGKRKPLAQWLHGYMSTHAEWKPHKVETLKIKSGSETKELWKFRQNLTIALKHLRGIGLIEEFRINEKDLVFIIRKPSKSQQKHLELKK